MENCFSNEIQYSPLSLGWSIQFWVLMLRQSHLGDTATSKPTLIKPPVKAWRKMEVGKMTDHLRPKPRVPIVRIQQAGSMKPATVQPKQRKNWAATVKKRNAKQQKLSKSNDEIPFSLQRGMITDHMRRVSAMAVNEKAEFLMPPPPPRKRKSPVIEYEEPDDEEKNKESSLKHDAEELIEARKNKEIASKELEQLRRKTTEFLVAISKLREDYSQHQLAKAKLKIRIQRLDDQLAGHCEQEPVGMKYRPEWYIRDRLLHFQNTNNEGAVTIHGMNIRGMRVPDWLHNMSWNIAGCLLKLDLN